MSKAESNGLSNKNYERILSSIKTDARKIREALERMNEDREKLEAGHPAPALVLEEATTVISVGLKHLSNVFKAEF